MARFGFCLFLLLITTTPPLLSGPGDTLLYADLNGDTAADTIRVATTADGYDVVNGCTITINGRTLGVPLQDVYQVEVAIGDIDGGDNQREVILTAIGSGSAASHYVVRLNGNRPVISAPLVGNLSFPGEGVVRAEQWMGFWNITRSYRLDGETMGWEVVPQDLYELSVAGKTTKSVTLLSAHEPKAKPAAKLKPQSPVTVVGYIPTSPAGGSNGEDWYQIKTATGAIGWLQLKDVREKITLPWEGS
ncbi:MAG: hypothetical protein K1X90_15080 [Candidatus Kapabacteria bacterium]|nr:hypothetical protein [Candidatus Kapabacteria bacterium]